MNEIIYNGRAFLEGPHNCFRLGIGLRPSFGLFRCTEADIDYLFNAGQFGAHTLTFNTAPLANPIDPHTTVILEGIYAVRAQVAESGLVESATSSPNKIWDVLLADERITWQFIYGDSAYNTYKADWPAHPKAETDFELENLNEGAPWTYPALLTELFTKLGITAPTFPTGIDVSAIEPRQIVTAGRPIVDVLEEILTTLCIMLCVDPTVTTAARYSLVAYKDIGSNTSAEIDHLYKGFPISRCNPMLNRPVTVVGSAPTYAPNAYYDGPRQRQKVGSKTLTYGTGELQLPIVQPLLTASDGDYTNLADVTAIGDALATIYEESWTGTESLTSSGTEWVLAGIHSGIFVGGTLVNGLNKYVQEITWQSTANGAFTCCRSFRPPQPSITKSRNTLYTYGDYLLPQYPTSVFPVIVSVDGGVAGDESTDCSFTYEVDDINENKLGDSLTPQKPRAPLTTYLPGTLYGWAFWLNGTLILLDALEREAVEVCT